MQDDDHEASTESNKQEMRKVSNSAEVKGCLVGSLSGGCLLPLILFLLCAAIFDDVGGPLFWPFIALPLGFVGGVAGLLIGFWIRSRSTTQAHNGTSDLTEPKDAE